jgi:hypothetical protein
MRLHRPGCCAVGPRAGEFCLLRFGYGSKNSDRWRAHVPVVCLLRSTATYNTTTDDAQDLRKGKPPMARPMHSGGWARRPLQDCSSSLSLSLCLSPGALLLLAAWCMHAQLTDFSQQAAFGRGARRCTTSSTHHTAQYVHFRELPCRSSAEEQQQRSKESRESRRRARAKPQRSLAGRHRGAREAIGALRGKTWALQGPLGDTACKPASLSSELKLAGSLARCQWRAPLLLPSLQTLFFLPVRASEKSAQ